jgi:pyruvate dehydrogenase E2 component (dihydrolipoamide acetyltransferase)
MGARLDAIDLITANIIWSTARLLQEFPRLNACCLNEQDLLYKQVNIGYALDAGLGLKVAVLRNADQLTASAIIEERQRLITGYLNQSLPPADLSGGTFTITDLSGSGIKSFDPLISEGQAGILGISGEFAIGAGQLAFHLVLSFDHRLVEGRAAATFLSQLKDQIVQFEQSLIETPIEGAPELCCSRCGITLSQATLRNHFLVSVVGPLDGTTHVCTICLQGR